MVKPSQSSPITKERQILMTEVPRFMQSGSKGTMAITLNSFLGGWMAGKGVPMGNFKIDDSFASEGSRVMSIYQAWNRISPDGGCGPETRAQLKKDGFDFETIAKQTPGRTLFVQAGGEGIDFLVAE